MPKPNCTHMTLRATTALATAVLAACALGACGSKTAVVTETGGASASTSTSESGTTKAAQSHTTSTGQTSTPATTTTSGATTTIAASGTPACTAAMLKLAFLGGQGATGHGELGFSLTNTSGHSCHTFGFPGVLFLDASGQALPTRSSRTTHDFFGTASEVALTVETGASVSFRLGVTHGAASPAGCTTAHGLQVIPPDDTHALRTKIGNGGAYECRTATVSPVRPGTSAYP